MFGKILSGSEVSASGMAAERTRMQVIANNIANAQTTRGENGEAFRRKNVVFATAFDDAMGNGDVRSMRGVRVLGVEADQSELPRLYRPGHPDADGEGFITMPNVEVANEMVDLITASRGYEANLRVMRSFREMVERTLDILRGV